MISSTRNPSRTRHKSLESLVRLTAHAGFGGRLSGKGPNYRDLAGQPTLQLRPLGMPTWSDKLVGEVVRLLLEAFYEPQFSDTSHGFRKFRGCHTALREINNTWTGTAWFAEGDISDCFGSLDHDILLGIMAEKIHDNRFLRLVRHMLKAGYLEEWEYHDTLSGVPQGGTVSPVLSNIYLDKLDKFVEQELIPQYTRGGRRRLNPEYNRTAMRLRRTRKRGDRAEARDLLKQLRTLPRDDPMDPGYRRLKYTRYADDHILGLSGRRPKPERSRPGWRSSSGRPSDWNSTRTRPSSRTPAPSGPGSSAMTSASGTATRKSPAAAGRPTGKSR